MGCFVDDGELDIKRYMAYYISSQEGDVEGLDGRFDLFDYLFRVKVYSGGEEVDEQFSEFLIDASTEIP